MKEIKAIVAKLEKVAKSKEWKELKAYAEELKKRREANAMPCVQKSNV